MAGSDRGPLTALVAYQQEVVFGYIVALRKAPFGDRDRGTLERFRRDAEQTVATLRAALQREGVNPPPVPDPNAAPPQADPSRRGFLESIIGAEEAAVASYYTALQGLSDEGHVKGCAAFMAQGGRRLVVLRQLAGQSLLPHAFETGGA
jgi:hypothetical protein